MPIDLVIQHFEGELKSLFEFASIEQLNEQLYDGVPVDELVQFQMPAESEELLDEEVALATRKNEIQVSSKELMQIAREVHCELLRCCRLSLIGQVLLLQILSEFEYELELLLVIVVHLSLFLELLLLSFLTYAFLLLLFPCSVVRKYPEVISLFVLLC